MMFCRLPNLYDFCSFLVPQKNLQAIHQVQRHGSGLVYISKVLVLPKALAASRLSYATQITRDCL